MEAAGRNWVYLATLSGLGAAALYVAMGPSATDKRALRRRRRRGYPPGLVNLGNTCFVNATLQALAAAPAFRCWLAAVVPALQARTSDSRKEDGKVDSKGSSRNDGVAKALSDVLNVLGGDQPADDNVEGLSAKPVLDALRFHGWSISPDQHDALEVLNVCFTSLEEEIQKRRGGTNSGPGHHAQAVAASLNDSIGDAAAIEASDDGKGDNGEGEDKVEKPEDEPRGRPRLRRNSSGVFSRSASDLRLSPDSVRRQMTTGMASSRTPFCGTMASKVFGSDGNRSSPVSSHTFSAVTLMLPRPSQSPMGPFAFLGGGGQSRQPLVTLETLLQMYVSREALDGSPASGGPSSKQLTFARLPTCLLLHIQRIGVAQGGGGLIKRNEEVLLPRFLNMDNFTYTGQLRKEIRLAAALSGQEEAMASGSGTGHESACFYRLCSVIVHLGGVDSGHYVTYRRSAGADDRWFVVSDEVVEEVAETRVLQCPAYIVIYERCPRLSAQSPIMDPTSP